MNIDSIYKKLITSLDLTKSRIVRFPSLVFLCGGPVSQGETGYKSCRDIFYRSIKSSVSCSYRKNVVLAEDIFRYFDHSSYRDLISFERDLAELSSLTVIFSESPGSIAELGSFATIKEVHERLLVVMHEDDANKESFVWRGPALYLREIAREEKREDPISIYNWQRSKLGDELLSLHDFSDVEDLSEAIEKILGSTSKSCAFNKDQPGHVMLLILDLLKVLNLASLEEIIDILKLLGIEIKPQKMEQHLSLLISLNYAVRKSYGHYSYYLSSSHMPWISFTFNKDALIRDVERWRITFLEHYSEKQINKYRALKSYMKTRKKIKETI